MQPPKKKKLFAQAVILAASVLCLYPFKTWGGDKIHIFVSIPPQQYFVEKIGGDRVDVSVMVMPGADPHTYEPKPTQMAKMASTEIYFSIGVSFESTWLPKISKTYPGMRIVHMDEGIEKMDMLPAHDHGEEDQRAEKGYHHDAGDPHVWTSPLLVKILCENIRNTLTECNPENQTIYEENYRRFADEIDAMDSEFKAMFSGMAKSKSFMVFHPSWGYFAREYGLKQIPVEVEGKDPKPAQLEKLIKLAKGKGIQMIFVQPQFSTRNAEVVARAIGAQVVYADPLAYDWSLNIRQQAEAIKSALK
jgi:zinc transport system substrate-binding protein